MSDEYEKAWAEEKQLEAGQKNEPDMAKDAPEAPTAPETPKVEVAAPVQTANHPAEAAVAASAASVAAAPAHPVRDVKAEAQAKADSDAEEFRKAFMEAPEVGQA